MNNLYRTLLYALLAVPFMASAQDYQVSGVVLDAKDKSTLIGVPVTIAPAADTAKKQGAATDADGHFSLSTSSTGKYLLTIRGLGYATEVRQVIVAGDVAIGSIMLRATNTTLKGVTVTGQQTRAEQNGDTSSFNAGSFKVNPDATAEDLIKKMPGVTSDGNGVKVNGEDVKKVLVDGKPFFGDDPNASLKNLPAEIIDKVEVFDNQSDQARFTGFNDGNQEKTINLVTKKGKNEGVFGKVYAGYGTDNRYQSSLTLNYFSGARRISLLGLANNINQQNFSIADVMSVMSNSGASGGGPGGPPGGGNNNSSSNRSGGSSNFGGPGGLLTSQQNGITSTKSLGLNYSDEWGKKIKVSGSYFFNNTNNDNESQLSRHYFTDTSLTYNQTSGTQTKNTNNRASLRFEYAIDSANALTVTPRITFQQNNYSTTLNAATRQAGELLNTTATRQSVANTGYSFTNNVLYQHKFGKRGRTVSLNLGQQLSNQNGTGSYYSDSYYSADSSSTILDQHYTIAARSTTLSGTLSYTEPVGKHGQVQASYSPSYNTSKADKQTRDLNGIAGEYTDLDTTLSNQYSSTYTTQRVGLAYRYNKAKFSFNLGIDAQQSALKGDQVFPVAFKTDRTFSSVLPSANLNYKIAQGQNLNIDYRSTNNAPTITQLQSVPDVSNPLQVTTGNPDLRQTYEHNIRFRYGKTNKATSRNFFIAGGASYIADYISNTTFIATQDTVIDGGYRLNTGSQLTRPVNLDNYYSARTFAVYSLPVKALKSNLNVNGSVNYTHTPALINNELNYSKSVTANGGAYLGSNISQNVDFSLAYNGSYNVVRNTVNATSDNSYYTGNATLRANVILPMGLVLNTDVTHTMYSGLTQDYNLSFLLWNAYVGYKFLKDRSLEAKLSVYDILNQNQSVSRTVTEAYTQDTKTNVLQRYGMLTLTYTLRQFKKGSAQPEGRQPDDRPPFPPGGGPGGPPPGGMGAPPPGGN